MSQPVVIIRPTLRRIGHGDKISAAVPCSIKAGPLPLRSCTAPTAMKTAAAFLALLALAASAHVAQNVHHKKVVADQKILNQQRDLLQLLVRVHQPNMYLEQKSLGDQWNLEAQLDSYSDNQVVKKYITMWKKNTLLPRGEIFSVLRDNHMEEAVALFDLFYFAKDYDTFYKTACWARDRVNEGIFVYSLHVAVLHRQDTKQILLPPIFEILPHLFIDARTIQQAFEARMQYAGVSSQQTRTVIIPTNYTRFPYMKANPEYLMSPWTEDIGLNAYYAYFHLFYPFWMKAERYGHTVDRYGEMYYYVQQQILARYNLQRLAAGLQEVEYLKFNQPIKYGYSSQLRYANGLELPTRPDNYYITDNYEFDKVQTIDIERRIRDAIDLGYVIKKDGSKVSIYEPQGFEILGSLISGTYNSVNYNYYGALYNKLRRLLSFAVDPNHMHGVAPGVTEHFVSVLRDPAYYQVCARVDYLFRRYKSKLDRYTVDQLAFPGVRIENVEVDKLVTYFDEFDVDLMNAIDVSSIEDGERLKIIARTQRLNYKPFTYKFTINSDKSANVMVRVFLGPKYDAAGHELNYEQMRPYMVEMDRFPYKLTNGQTVITRNSHDSTWVIKDRSSMWDHLRKVNNAIHNHEEMFIDDIAQYCGFPQRLLLPKVYKTSMPFVLFVMVTPYEGPMEVPQTFASCGVGFDVKYPDTYPMGYPFDRPINNWDFYTPNMYFKDVLIFHKKKGDLTINV
ncbi:Hexamerin [Gryllus bimaculatus]|nr:Hexamerin [Gryllus bimaculatus]